MATESKLSKLINSKLAEDRSDAIRHPIYNAAGDFVAVYLRDEACYSERIDELLTVFKSCENGELIGCKIKGVSLLAENYKHMFKITEGGDLKLGLLLYGAMGARQVDYYYELNELVGDITVPASEFKKAA